MRGRPTHGSKTFYSRTVATASRYSTVTTMREIEYVRFPSHITHTLYRLPNETTESFIHRASHLLTVWLLERRVNTKRIRNNEQESMKRTRECGLDPTCSLSARGLEWMPFTTLAFPILNLWEHEESTRVPTSMMRTLASAASPSHMLLTCNTTLAL